MSRRAGHVFYEYYLLLAAVGISLAIAVGQSHGRFWRGLAAFLMTWLAFGALALAFALLCGAGDWVEAHWGKSRAFNFILQGIGWVSLFVLFTAVGSLSAALISELAHPAPAMESWLLLLGPVIGAVAVAVRHRLKDRFWPLLGAVAAAAAVVGCGACLGLLLGAAAFTSARSQLLSSLAGALAPVLIGALRFWLRKRPAGDPGA